MAAAGTIRIHCPVCWELVAAVAVTVEDDGSTLDTDFVIYRQCLDALQDHLRYC